MKTKTRKLPKGWTKFDAADYLKTDKDIKAFIKMAFEEEDRDPEFIAAVLGVAARARGMTQFSKKTGISRATLYKALAGEGNFEFSTVVKALKAFGLKLRVA